MPIIYNSNFANSAGAAMREFAPVNKSVRDTMFKLEELRMREEAMDQREAQFRTRLEQQASQFEKSQQLRLDLQDRADQFSQQRLDQQNEQFERSQGLREQQQAQRDRLAEIGLARQAELDKYQKEQDELSREFAGEQLELKKVEAERAHQARLKNLDLSERELEARTGTTSKARQQELKFYYDSVPDDGKFSPTAQGFAQGIAALQGVVRRGETFGEKGQGVDVLTLDEAAQIEQSLNEYLGIDIARDGLPSQEQLEANPGFGPAMAVLGRALSTAQNRLLDHSINKGYTDWVSSSEKVHSDFFDTALGAELTGEVVSNYQDALQLQGDERAEAISALEVAKMNWTRAAKLQDDKAYVTNLIRKEMGQKKDDGDSSFDIEAEDQANKLLSRLNSNSFQGDPSDILMEARILYDSAYRKAADFGRRQAENAGVDVSNLTVEDVASAAAPPVAPPVAAPTADPSTTSTNTSIPSTYTNPIQRGYHDWLDANRLRNTPENMEKYLETEEGRRVLNRSRAGQREQKQFDQDHGGNAPQISSGGFGFTTAEPLS
tara:strand:- start:1881 stop:3530 length:1650 start_codon:yes stop_codon:yes gene_type:complete